MLPENNMRSSSKSKKRFVLGKGESGVRGEGQEAAGVCYRPCTVWLLKTPCMCYFDK